MTRRTLTTGRGPALPATLSDPDCDAIAEQIEREDGQAEALEDLLEDPELTPAQRGRIRLQISTIQARIDRLERELAACRADLRILGVEQTQGIQFHSLTGQGSGYAPDNSVPLIAQRTLVLRAYVDHRRAGSQLPGHLPINLTGTVTVDRVLTDGRIQRVTTLQPINGSIAARTLGTLDRGDPDHTLNFRVRANDCQGQLRFTVTVSEDRPVIVESAAAPDRRAGRSAGPSASIQVFARFDPVPAFRVQPVLVHYTGDGMDLPAPSGFDFAATLDYVLRTYPIGRLEFEDCLEIDFDKNLRTPGGGCGPGFEGPGGLMEILADIDDMSDRPAIRVALIPRQAMMSVSGCGNRNIAATRDGQQTLAQEMGHALDRKHAPAGGAGGADPDFPEYNDTPGSIGEYGFDVMTSDVYGPSTIDFMGYGSSRWVSPYTYAGIRAAMIDRFGDPQLRARRALPPVAAADRQELLFLRFRVWRDGGVTLRPSFHLSVASQPPERTDMSDVAVELLAKDGAVLAFHRCRRRGPHHDPASPYVDFREALPWVDDAAAIRWLRGSEVLHVHDIESQAPTLQLDDDLRFSASPMTLRWSADHPNAQNLTYLVRFSADGGATWRVVAHKAAPELDLAARLLPGGDQCLVQVVASSGIRTTAVQSEPFKAPIKKRSAAILTPNPADCRKGGRVLLCGGAFSADYGMAEPEDVVWTSSIDGLIGHGFELVSEPLSVGVHVITLAAPDGTGGLASASTTITVTHPSTS